MNILDLVLLAIIGYCVWDGYKNGLVKQLLDLAGVVIAFFIASRFGAQFGQWLSGFLNLEKFATRLVVGKTDGLSGVVAGVVEGAMPDIIAGFEDIIGYIALFFLALAAVKLIAVLIGMITKLPVLGAVDKIGGLALGLLKGGLIALAAVWILNLLPAPSVMDSMASSKVAQILLGVAPGLYAQIFNAEKYQEVLGLVKKVQGALKP